MSDRRPAAESALELLLLADIQAAADRLRHRGRPHRAASGASPARRGAAGRRFTAGPARQPRRDVEELDAEADRLARWYGALIAVAGACADVLAERVPA